MPTLLEKLAAKIAFLHARSVFSRFRARLAAPEAAQHDVLRRVLRSVAAGDYAHSLGFGSVRTIEDLRRAAPIVTYDDLRPHVDRVYQGQTRALFSPGVRVQMFATSSGTTARPKLIPVTAEFVRQYRRGWNTFGLKMLSDHPAAVLRAILQGSGRVDDSRSPRGVPCGAITGLLASTQKSIVRRFYVGRPEIAHIDDPRARYYTLMRFAAVRDVAFAITANPATLIRMAQVIDQEAERLIRDVHDGAIDATLVPDPKLRTRLSSGLRRDPARARAIAALRQTNAALRPRDLWKLEFLACWTGGSMSYYLDRLAEWYGAIPVRDVGLLASEGRVTIPLDDGTPAGVLDVQSSVFEFIPYDRWHDASAPTLLPPELESDRDYVVVLTNDAGLIRYRLDDVVRVRGWIEQTPVLEFLHRAGRVASIAGEKLTEHQVVQAVTVACKRLSLPEFDYVMAPRWGDPPSYVLSTSTHVGDPMIEAIDAALGELNFEYKSRRNSSRLGMLSIRNLGHGAIERMDQRLISMRGSTAEQYKRPCLFTEPDGDVDALGLPREGTSRPGIAPMDRPEFDGNPR